MPIGIQDIIEARKRIENRVQKTPVNTSRSVSQRIGTQTFLKLENQQTTGSFKIRGSLNKMLTLTPQELRHGLVASSAGNHAQGVALAAQMVGAKAYVVMPETAPLAKVIATQAYGAQVILKGRIYDEAYQHARELEKEHGYTFIHPYEDDKIIAGQGTLGLELNEQIPELDSVVVPIGGGGLISGVATALKHHRPKIKIYGVVSSVAPGMKQMFKGESVDPPQPTLTIADGISVKKPSPRMYDQYISKLVDDIVEVSDEEISESIVYFLERAKTMVEGSGAVVLAGAEKAGWDLGKNACLVLSGGNIDLNLVSKVIERGLSRRGRLIRLSVVVADRPGSLNRLTNVIAETGANILDVKHDRVRQGVLLSETAIEFLLETKSLSHAEALQEALRKTGARIT
ncbi:MAG TPA: threonine ammonia-lyase [Bdellovibrionales bacterium]|nr:threonine ammonia-lyase [Bdellovibrionales bacterium]